MRSLLGLLIFLLTFIFSINSLANTHIARDLAANCTSCHGTNGVSVSAIPSIAGLQQSYFAQQMRDFKAGKRSSTIMQQIAKGYSEGQIELLAAYFAAQKR